MGSHLEIIKVPGVVNFRGLGGIKVGNKTFKNGLAFRCANLCHIKEKGVKTLQNLNICVDIDLRTDREKTEKPDPKLEGVEIFEYDILSHPTTGISREEVDAKNYIEFVRACKPMEELYVHILTACLPAMRDAFRKSIECLLQGKPFLFHCSEGKDRTGILALLILGILGAKKEDIMRDYLLTMRYGKKKRRLQAQLLKLKDYEAGKKAYSMFVVRPSYLENAYSVIEKEGGFINFAIHKLGLDEETIERLRIVCLE